VRSFLSQVGTGKQRSTSTARTRSGAKGSARTRNSARPKGGLAARFGSGRTAGKKTAARRPSRGGGTKKGAAGAKSATAGSRSGFAPATWFARREKTRAAEPPPETAAAEQARRRPPVLLRALIMLVAFAGMVAFAVVLSRLTLEPSVASEPLTHSNLRPGDSINAYLSQPAFRDTVKQLGGNVVLGVPFGLLLPVLVPKARGLIRVVLLTAGVMMLVELAQGALVTGRAFDIDDVILNTSGAVLGYLLLGRRIGRAVHPPRRRWWHRMTGRPVPH
jgi:glycopeptide antibiotics resistance protein